MLPILSPCRLHPCVVSAQNLRAEHLSRDMGYSVQIFALATLLLMIVVFFTLQAPVLWPYPVKLALNTAVAVTAFSTLAALIIAT